MRKERVWLSFFLSILFPVIGGIINYFSKIKKDKNLAIICLFVSIFHPSLIRFISYYLLYDFLNVFELILFMLILFCFIIDVFKGNPYKYFLPTFYFGIIGAIYSYYKYTGNKHLQKNVLLFLAAQITLNITIALLVFMLDLF